jgi:hypothetical protein
MESSQDSEKEEAGVPARFRAALWIFEAAGQRVGEDACDLIDATRSQLLTPPEQTVDYVERPLRRTVGVVKAALWVRLNVLKCGELAT